MAAFFPRSGLSCGGRLDLGRLRQLEGPARCGCCVTETVWSRTFASLARSLHGKPSTQALASSGRPLSGRTIPETDLWVSGATTTTTIPRRGLPVLQGRGVSSFPENVEELQDILSKDKGEVDEKLRNNAIKIEYEFLRYEFQAAPNFMSDEMWERLLNEKTEANRRRLYKFFFLRENFKRKKVRKQAEGAKFRSLKKSQELAAAEEEPDEHFPARFSLNRKIDDALMKKDHRLHLDYAFRFGQPLVFDLGQEYEMNISESSSFVKQMREVYTLNRAQWEPFNIHLCNYNAESQGMKDLVHGVNSTGYMWEVTENCFTSLFPRERLVYLSPDAPEVAEDWRHDDVYIVGGVVDKGNGGGKMTLSKVKQLGIRSQRFDIDKYFKKKQAPLLTLDTVFACLIDARDTDGNWLYSYRNLPNRMVRWRPQYSFMKSIPSVHARNESKVIQCHRNIFKPRMKDFPYSEFVGKEEEDSDDDELLD